MKFKKVLAILMMMTVSAGMAAPQTMSPIGTVMAFAEELPEEDVSQESTEVQSEENTAVVQVSTESELTSALAGASKDQNNPTVIELQNDIIYTGRYLNVASGTYVTLQSAPGASYTLEAAGTCFVSRSISGFIYVQGNLTLKNITVDAKQKDRCAYIASGAVAELGDGASFINGGGQYVTGGSARSPYGCGAYVLGTFIMDKGSKISDCTIVADTSKFKTSIERGLGVFVNSSAQFIMNGGEISGNTSSADYIVNGGGVSVNGGGSFVMNGGTIRDNEIYGSGSGVYLNNASAVLGRTAQTVEGTDASLYDDAAVIENNQSLDNEGYNGLSGSSNVQGAGVYVYGKATIQSYSDESTVIRNNTVRTSLYTCDPEVFEGNKSMNAVCRGCGGGIFVAGTDSSVTMTGGKITGNAALCDKQPETDEETEKYHYASGGGVYVLNGVFEMSGGEISGNSASAAWTENELAGTGGGVCVGFSANNSAAIPTGSLGTFHMTGGEVKNNTSAKGKDIYLADMIPLYSTGMAMPGQTTSEGRQEVAASPVLTVGGEAQVGEIYLPSAVEDEKGNVTGKAVIQMTSALSGEGVIGVDVENPEYGTVIVEQSKEYAPQFSDERAFSYTGTAEVSIRLDGNHNLSLQEKTDTTSLEGAAVTFQQEDQSISYSGEKQTPKPTVTLDGKVLVEGTDYVLSYRNNTNAGTASVVVNGIGKFTGSAEASFEIAPLDITDSEDITADEISDQLVTGEAVTPKVTVRYKNQALVAGNEDSEEAYDYSVSYTDNTELGIASATVTGHGNFTGTREVQFNIVDPEGTRVSDGKTLEQAIESADDTTADNPLVISLTADITLDGTDDTDGIITIPESAYIQIVGYGHTITAQNDIFATADQPDTAMFVVPEGSGLTLNSVTLDGAYKGRLLYVKKGGNAVIDKTVIMQHGKAADQLWETKTEEDETVVTSEISANESNKYFVGGQVIFNAGTVLFSGSITNNFTTQHGTSGYGVIYNDVSGQFTMMSGSRIEDVALVSNGAVYNAGEFTMEGGTITKTRVTTAANAKAVVNVGSFTMKDGSSITENTGLYSTVYNSGEFSMEGGEISKNTNDLGCNLTE